MIKKYLNKIKVFYNKTKDNLSTQETQNLIKANKKYFMSGIVVLFTICFFAFNLGGILKNVWTSLSNLFSNEDGEVKQLVLKSDGYDESLGGSVQITKSADWTGKNTAKIVYEVNTIAKLGTANDKDVIFVIDISGSMSGTKISKVKKDVKEITTSLLSNSNNNVALITFDTTSTIVSELTNDADLINTEAQALTVGGQTNYQAAFKNVNTLLSNYEVTETRDLIVLFLTDGYPNVGTPNEVAQYEILKEKYPNIIIQGVQYEMGKTIVDEIKQISDSQFAADVSNLDNVLYEAISTAEYYETFEVIEYVDNNYFYVESIDDITVSKGNVTMTQEDGVQKIVWTAQDKVLKSGSSAEMEINLKLQESKVGVEGLYPTSTGEEFSFKFSGEEITTVESDETTILKNGYTVTYSANAPEGCDVSIDSSEIYYAYDIVELSDKTLSCDEYVFKGWEVAEEVTKISDESFVMPTYNVTVRGTWTKVELNKTMDGMVYEKLTLYKAIADQAVLDDTSSEYVTNSTGINFSQVSSNTNGKGVYTLASTATDEYPIHYFRGNIDNNHVIFAGYCWEIIRTTETGGVKLIYDGVPSEEGYCTNTGTNSRLTTTKEFNPKSSSLAYAGYMYDSTAATNYTDKARTFGSSEDVLTLESMGGTDYYSKTVTHDGTNYVLGDDATTYTWGSNYSTLGSGYYTCLSPTATSCSTVYYIAGATSSFAYIIPMSGGKLLSDVNTQMKFSSTYTDNGDGTYTLDSPVSITKSTWATKHSTYKNYYICSDHTSTTCASLRYIKSTSAYQYGYLNVANNYLYGNSFTWDGTNYTLTDTKQFWNWASNYNTLSNNHYTCFDTDGVCTTLYYIHTTGSSYAYYIQLAGGKSVEDALDEMLNADLTPNSTDSTIKDYIDNTWYAGNMTDYTKYLENTVWCNDRSIYSLGGWNPDGGSTTSYLYFGSYRRATTSILGCDSEDSFTLSKDAGGVDGYGNNALDYPVGLITADEVMLAGGRGGGVTNTSYYLYKNQSYWTLSPSLYERLYGVHGSYVTAKGELDYDYDLQNAYGVRPVISLIPGLEYDYGNGSADNPYVIITE